MSVSRLKYEPGINYSHADPTAHVFFLQFSAHGAGAFKQKNRF
jgi:hypothetical protein